MLYVLESPRIVNHSPSQSKAASNTASRNALEGGHLVVEIVVSEVRLSRTEDANEVSRAAAVPVVKSSDDSNAN